MAHFQFDSYDRSAEPRGATDSAFLECNTPSQSEVIISQGPDISQPQLEAEQGNPLPAIIKLIAGTAGKQLLDFALQWATEKVLNPAQLSALTRLATTLDNIEQRLNDLEKASYKLQ